MKATATIWARLRCEEKQWTSLPIRLVEIAGMLAENQLDPAAASGPKYTLSDNNA